MGLGVIGGSLARALAALGGDRWPGEVAVTGWSPDPVERASARASGAVGSAPDGRAEAVAGADLVIVAAPLSATCSLMSALSAEAESDATITDVASLKVPVAEAAHRAGLEDRWIGCHPMTGSEASGFAASKAELYRDATVWTVAAPAAEDRLRRVHALWEAIGARPARTSAAEHDRLMGLASHLPQLAATALAGVLSEAGVPPGALGPGGRDMTRLAASSPTMWRDLLAHAPPEAAAGLRALAEAATVLADRMESGDVDAIEAAMERTAAWRRV